MSLGGCISLSIAEINIETNPGVTMVIDVHVGSINGVVISKIFISAGCKNISMLPTLYYSVTATAVGHLSTQWGT